MSGWVSEWVGEGKSKIIAFVFNHVHREVYWGLKSSSKVLGLDCEALLVAQSVCTHKLCVMTRSKHSKEVALCGHYFFVFMSYLF